MNEQEKFERVEVLKTRLQIEVPIWIEQLRYSHVEETIQSVVECNLVLKNMPSLLEFTDPKDFEMMVDILAKGLACLTFKKDRVEFLGLVFELPRKPAISKSHLRRPRRFRKDFIPINKEDQDE